MPYNSLTSRTDAAALIPEDVASEIIQAAVTDSAVLTMFRRATMSRAQQRMPVLSAFPTAYWVNGDTGIKQTSKVAWANKYLNAEEIAVIVPVPENVINDSDFDMWAEIRPRIVEAFARTLDSAVFFGTNAPASFPTNVQAAATAAGNNVTEAAAAAAGGVYGDLDNLIGTVEADGFDVTGYIAARSLRTRLRSARMTTGERLDANRVSPNLGELDGDPIAYPMRGLFPAGGGAGTNVRAFAGDFSQFVIGVRQDIEWKMLDQAVITDNTGAVIYNLPQQDMVALRCTFRAGWQVANPMTYDQPTDANRYPAGVLLY